MERNKIRSLAMDEIVDTIVVIDVNVDPIFS